MNCDVINLPICMTKGFMNCVLTRHWRLDVGVHGLVLGLPDQGPHTGLGDARGGGGLAMGPGAQMVPRHRAVTVTVTILRGTRLIFAIELKAGLKPFLQFPFQERCRF